MTSALSCPHCGSPVSAQDKFCANCGKQISVAAPASSAKPSTIVCTTCGRVNSSTNEICVGCGSPLIAAAAAEPRESATQAKPKQQTKKKRESALQTKYLLIIFVALAILIIVLEYRNAPNGSASQNRAASQQEVHSTDPSVLNEITNLETRVKTNPTDSQALLELANKLHDARFYPRAIETYKQFLALQPANADARVDMAICYFETGDSEQAVREIESVLKKEPKHQMAAFNLGVIQLSSGNLPEAKKWLKKAADLDPSSPAGQRAQELLQQH